MKETLDVKNGQTADTRVRVSERSTEDGVQGRAEK